MGNLSNFSKDVGGEFPEVKGIELSGKVDGENEITIRE